MVPRFNWFDEIHNFQSWQHWMIRSGRDLNLRNSANVYFFRTKKSSLRLLHEWAFVLLHYSWSLKVDKGKEFRKKSEKPLLKGAFIEEAIYVGDELLDTLVDIKSKEELLGEIITLLQSPAKNVISALKSGGGTIAGIVKTLSEREG